jgi:hypothetical protein
MAVEVDCTIPAFLRPEAIECIRRLSGRPSGPPPSGTPEKTEAKK